MMLRTKDASVAVPTAVGEHASLDDKGNVEGEGGDDAGLRRTTQHILLLQILLFMLGLATDGHWLNFIYTMTRRNQRSC